MKNQPLQNSHHSKEELAAMIVKMRQASSQFYNSAFKIGNHAFIEFCGLMNEYIDCCHDALLEGKDFTQFNIHSGQSMIAPYRRKYLVEKLECILGVELVGRQAEAPKDTAKPKYICDCCGVEVSYVRGSVWHGTDKICRPCFFIWYEDNPGRVGTKEQIKTRRLEVYGTKDIDAERSAA